jgi:hypothetical protein
VAVAGAFVSPLYGYQLTLPEGWETQAASSLWTSGSLEGRCPPDWDCFSDPTGERTLAVAAVGLPASLTVDQWRLRLRLTQPGICSDVGAERDTRLDGEAAQEWSATCSSEDLDSIKEVAVHQGRAYAVLLASPTSIGLAADQATFDDVMQTFRFAGA